MRGVSRFDKRTMHWTGAAPVGGERRPSLEVFADGVSSKAKLFVVLKYYCESSPLNFPTPILDVHVVHSIRVRIGLLGEAD